MITIFNKIIILIFLTSTFSCSFNKKESIYGGKEYLDGLVSQVRPRWFSAIKRFSLDNHDGEPTRHMFFDANPKLNLKTKTVSSIIVTPAESKELFDFDTKSGKVFYQQHLCGTYDSEKRYNGPIKTPNFSIGFIPRYLDQINRPQEVIVFGGNDFVSKYYKTHSIDVKIVGGFVQRICPRGGCIEVKDWVSRLVLIAVQKGDKKFRNIDSLDGLRNKVDWEYTMAFLKNGLGKNKVGNKYYSAYQVGEFVNSFRAIKYIQQRSNFFDIAKMQKTKKSCLELYDYANKTFSHKSILDLENSSLETYKAKKKLKDQLKKSGGQLVKSFSKRFKEFYDKYGTDFVTCSKFVYASNINDDVKRHWMFAYLESVFKLNDLGYVYNCSSEKWGENALVESKEFLYPRSNQFSGCSNTEIETGIKLAPKFLEGLALRGYPSYRYVSYDKKTHQKIYSWVKTTNKKFKCSKSMKNSFPSDIRWKR